MSSQHDDSKKRGEIDLVRLFEAEAIELLSAAERGKVLHGTKNIRESGGPLEASFRALLQKKLPSVYRILSGYLFDASSECTPQIDAFVAHGDECHELMTSSEGTSYVPFAGALSVIEVKNTTYDVASSLSQLSTTLDSIALMRKNAARDSGVRLPKLLSVAFFADSSNCSLSNFQRWYMAHGPHNSPTYTILLDKALIIAFAPKMMDSFEYDDGLDFVRFREHENPGKVYLCRPRERSNARGRSLLWLYLAIADHLSKSNASQLNGYISAFTAAAERTYALDRCAPLDNIRDWRAYDEASSG